MKTVIFDLETFGLHANDGVLLCCAYKEYGHDKTRVIRADEFPTWKNHRSNVKDVCGAIIDALNAVHSLHNSIYLRAAPSSAEFDEQLSAENFQGFRDYVTEQYKAAWARHDGTFFRKLADAMEVHQKAADAAYTCLGSEIVRRKQAGQPMPTTEQAVEYLRACEVGKGANRRTVERIADFFRVRLSQSSRGRPKSKRPKRA